MFEILFYDVLPIIMLLMALAWILDMFDVILKIRRAKK